MAYLFFSMCVVLGPWLRLLFACWVIRGFYFAHLEAGVAVLSACEVAQQPYERLIPTPASSGASDFFWRLYCLRRERGDASTDEACTRNKVNQRERKGLWAFHFRLSVLSIMQKETFSISSLVDANAIEWPSWMQGKFYLNAAFLSPHFWRSLPRERCIRDVCLFSRFIVTSQARQAIIVCCDRKKGQINTSFQTFTYWIIGRYLRFWHGGGTGLYASTSSSVEFLWCRQKTEHGQRNGMCITNDLKQVPERRSWQSSAVFSQCSRLFTMFVLHWNFFLSTTLPEM